MARSFDYALARIVQKANAASSSRKAGNTAGGGKEPGGTQLAVVGKAEAFRAKCEARLLGRLGDWVLANPLPDTKPEPGQAAVLWIPGRPCTPNDRMHWAAKAKVTRKIRYDVATAWLRLKLPLWHKPKSVTLTYVSAKETDADNAIAACKAHRDQVAEMCGFNDRERVWTYAQTTGPEVGVRVEVVWP